MAGLKTSHARGKTKTTKQARVTWQRHEVRPQVYIVIRYINEE